MGYGDEVMLTGLAKGAAARGKRVAFGDGQRIIWGPHSIEVFRNNPNITQVLDGKNIEWVHYHKGKRPTFKRTERDRYVWNYDFKVEPGEFYFDEMEKRYTEPRDGILIEPNVMWRKTVASNKDWGFDKYQDLCNRLLTLGHEIWQTSFGSKRLQGAKVIDVPNYRCMAATVRGFDLVVCPEGGMSHAAGAVGTKAVVIFGGFPAVPVVGYDFHENLNGGVEACGKYVHCQHCVDAMKKITVDEVLAACERLLV